jgi:predicted glycosyltransferase
MEREGHQSKSGPKKIWIDLDNSPHVPFFVPVVKELELRGYSVVLTARDCFQVSQLANLFDLNYRLVGRHYGKNKIRKFAGLLFRALQLVPTILREKPDLAVSHGSRAQLVAAAMLGVPSLILRDYEFSTGWVLIHPSWVMVPDVIPDAAVRVGEGHLLKYPGIKEDVYVPRFKPDPSIKAHLGLNGEDLIVTVRPPADEAHYHNPESDRLFGAVIDLVGHKPNARIVLLPRNERQAISVREAWPDLFASGKILIPQSAFDGLNLIWSSDLVISGGGTMNREAAALGVPVYSIFRGRLGAVDEYLARKGRLILLESVHDVQTKIVLARRNGPAKPENGNGTALQSIVNQIHKIMQSECRATAHEDE